MTITSAVRATIISNWFKVMFFFFYFIYFCPSLCTYIHLFTYISFSTNNAQMELFKANCDINQHRSETPSRKASNQFRFWIMKCPENCTWQDCVFVTVLSTVFQMLLKNGTRRKNVSGLLCVWSFYRWAFFCWKDVNKSFRFSLCHSK